MVPRLILLLSVLALMLVGFVMIYSTSSVIELSTAKSVAEAIPWPTWSSRCCSPQWGRCCAVVVWKFVPVSVWRGNLVWVVCVVAFGLLCGHLVLGRGRR